LILQAVLFKDTGLFHASVTGPRTQDALTQYLPYKVFVELGI